MRLIAFAYIVLFSTLCAAADPKTAGPGAAVPEAGGIKSHDAPARRQELGAAHRHQGGAVDAAAPR